MVSSDLHNTSLIEHHNLMSVFHRAQSVSYRYDSLSLTKVFQILHYLTFILGIK